MESIGIICEYNPFHNGHIYHLNQIKKMNPEAVIVLVLNGYFLQRGEISLLTKEDKIKLALDYQIDLIVELPVLYGTQAADQFAEAAIKILHLLKVNKIVFGSESNQLELLKKISNEQLKPEFPKKLETFLKQGYNYPTALAKAIDIDFDFNNPNDLLGISYIKAIQKNNWPIEPICIQRTSSYHDLNSTNAIISAANIRHKLAQKENIANYVPAKVLPCLKIVNESLFFQLLKVKILTTPHLEQFLTVDEGIENRLKKQIINCYSLEEFITKIKTKRYTYNRLKRMFIHILLGITKEDAQTKMDTITILGFNDKGRSYLNSIRSKMDISLARNKKSILSQYEQKASILYDILLNTNTYLYEQKHTIIKK